MKNSLYKIISELLFPIVYIAMFFVIGGTDHGATCWIGFGFTLFSYLMVVLIPLLAPKTKSAHIFGATSTTLNGIYFAINFVGGLFFIIKDFDEWKYALLAEMIIFVVFFVFLLQVLRTDEVTAAKEIKQHQEVSAVKELASKAKIIMDCSNDWQIQKIVQQVYNEINTCPTHSNGAVKDLEDAISYSLDSLKGAVLDNDVEATRTAALSTISLVKKRKEKSKTE